MIKKESKFTRIDYIIIFLCVAGACFSGAAFWIEYNRTLERLNEEPVGTIIFQRRVAQRRFIDRNVWDRLKLASLVFNGDTIRTIEQSEAIVIFKDEITHLNLNENTMVQIFFDTRIGTQIDFIEGNLEVVSEDRNIVITTGDSVIVVEGQAIMDKSEDGFVLSVSEGQASFDGMEVEAGNVLAFDSYGEISTNPIITVTSFGPFASFLGLPGEAVNVVFSWNNFFFNPDTRVIVEIAADRRFNRIVNRDIIAGDGISSVSIPLEHGTYWWRAFPASANSLQPINRLFPSGMLEIIPAVEPLLLSPLHEEELVFPDGSRVSFSWSVTEGAFAYLLEISAYADMRSPVVFRRIEENSVTQTGLDYGDWFWRVTPLFPPQTKGEALSSATGEFSVIRGAPIIAAPILAPAAGNLLMWNHDSNAAFWIIELADNFAMINPAVRQNTTSNFFSFSPELLQAGRNWYWRVTALGGAYPAVSVVQRFEATDTRPLASAIARPAIFQVAATPAVQVTPDPPAMTEIPVLPEDPETPAVLETPHFPPVIFSANIGDWYALGETAASNNITLLDIVRFLESSGEFRLRVEGHANATVNPANIEGRQREHIEELQPLSEIRAQAVVNRLVELGADPDRLDYEGLGGERPIAAWGDTANWWRNRRAEFIVVTEN